MKKCIFLSGLILMMIFSCNSQLEGIKNISVDDLKVVLKNDATIQLLDVRTPKEWNEGIIENAIKIDVTAEGFENLANEKLDKSKPVYIYCRSGGRSKIASNLLLKQGFQPYNVLGGYMDWEEKNK